MRLSVRVKGIGAGTEDWAARREVSVLYGAFRNGEGRVSLLPPLDVEAEVAEAFFFWGEGLGFSAAEPFSALFMAHR